MTPFSIQRHYSLKGLNFRDFWDLCCFYQRVNPEFATISYTIDGFKTYVVLEETDVATVLRKLADNKDRIRKYVARFFRGSAGIGVREPAAGTEGSTELVYRPQPYDDHRAGLYFYSDNVTKLSLFRFENLIYSNYELEETTEPQIEFGQPCEVVSAVIDMRGFSVFCEKPNIESPYTCGLMTAFYHMCKTSFQRYPPELLKFLGDGVLAVWQTTVEDRTVAIETAIAGTVGLNSKWQQIRRNPHFKHGAPEDIGCGLSFGLASKITIENDYIGRPVNLSSRLCGVCPGGKVLVDRAFDVPEEYDKKEQRVRIKSYGEYPVWILSGT